MPLQDYPNPAIGVKETVDQILRLRKADQGVIQKLEQSKMDGRDRTGVRAVPSSDADVVVGDLLDDVVKDGLDRYEIINDGGTLKWGLLTYKVGW